MSGQIFQPREFYFNSLLQLRSFNIFIWFTFTFRKIHFIEATFVMWTLFVFHLHTSRRHVTRGCKPIWRQKCRDVTWKRSLVGYSAYYYIFSFFKNSSFRFAYNLVHSRCFCGLHSSVKKFKQKLLCLSSGKVVFWFMGLTNERFVVLFCSSVFFLKSHLKRLKIASFASIAHPKIKRVKTVSILQECISRINLNQCMIECSINESMSECLP